MNIFHFCKVLSILLVLSLFSACATKDTRHGPIENFLEPPSRDYFNDNRGGGFVYKRAKIFVNGMYRKRAGHLARIKRQGRLDTENNIICVEKLEKAIKSFSWPVLWIDFREERDWIQDGLTESNCYMLLSRPRESGQLPA